MTAIYIRTGIIGDVDVSFRYNEQVVDLIKLIPAHSRSYDPATKVWTILDQAEAKIFIREASALGFEVVDSRKASKAKANAGSGSKARASTPKPPAADWAAAMFQQIPDDALRQKVYRALAKVLHPDTGGNAELFRQLTDAKDNRK